MTEHSQLCVTVTAPTTADLRRRRDEASDADLIELRLDGVRDPDPVGALQGRTRPVIVTCRPRWEGGAFDGSEDERRRLLTKALDAGAEYVDVEWQARFDDLIAGTAGRRVVISNHDFKGIPADLADRYRAMRGTGAELVKVAVKANRLSDCVTLLDLAKGAAPESRSLFIAMGDHGLASRILASRFRSAWTYAGSVSDVGQLAPRTLIDEFRFREIRDRSAVFGVFGMPVAHSVSPAMHNAALRHAGLDAVYLPLAAVDADDVMTFANAFGMSGASVTIPHKVTLVSRMQNIDEVSRRIGAINTMQRVDGRWTGANTDAQGFLRPLEARKVLLRGRRVAVLGSGGSARAVAVALHSTGAHVAIHGRNRAAAADVAALANATSGDAVPEAGSWEVLVNTTPVGMHPHVDATPVPARALTGQLVYDLVYNPPATRLMRDAEAAGCRTIGGIEMLVAQAEAQFERWTGQQPAAGLMREAADRRLREFVTHANHVV